VPRNTPRRRPWRKPVRITAEVLALLEPEPGRTRYVWDLDLTGFGVEVSGARRTYVVRCADGRGGGEILVIGEHGQVDAGGRRLDPEFARERAARLILDLHRASTKH
jgi:hypothetical protein